MGHPWDDTPERRALYEQMAAAADVEAARKAEARQHAKLALWSEMVIAIGAMESVTTLDGVKRVWQRCRDLMTRVYAAERGEEPLVATRSPIDFSDGEKWVEPPSPTNQELAEQLSQELQANRDLYGTLAPTDEQVAALRVRGQADHREAMRLHDEAVAEVAARPYVDSLDEMYRRILAMDDVPADVVASIRREMDDPTPEQQAQREARRLSDMRERDREVDHLVHQRQKNYAPLAMDEGTDE